MENNTYATILLFSACIALLIITLAVQVNNRDICRAQLANCEELYSSVIATTDQPTDDLPQIVKE